MSNLFILFLSFILLTIQKKTTFFVSSTVFLLPSAIQSQNYTTADCVVIINQQGLQGVPEGDIYHIYIKVGCFKVWLQQDMKYDTSTQQP